MPVVPRASPDSDLAGVTDQVHPDHIAAEYEEDGTLTKEVVKPENTGGEPTLHTKGYREYRYSPLQADRNIRLLRLSTSHGGESRQVSLEEVSLDNPPPYHALSYTWGAGEPQQPLSIGEYTIHVRENLFQALQKVSVMGVTLLWVDAICIHQEDDDERESQLMFMRDIFGKAECVIVDLGATPDQKPGLKEFLINIGNIRSLHPATDGPVHFSNFRWGLLQQYGLPSMEDSRWQSLNHFLERPWFSRVWILQEFASAKAVSLVCDGWILQLNELLAIFDCLNSFSLHRHGAISTTAQQAVHRFVLMSKLNAEVAHHNTLRPLVYLLQRDRYSEASDLRDHIYGLLGLSKDSRDTALKPKYSESLRHLYLRAAKYFVRQSNIPLLLNEAGIRTADESLPSWVPCWSNSLYRPVIDTDAMSDRISDVFRASGETQGLGTLTEGELVLKVRGIKFDEISRIGAGPALIGSLSLDEAVPGFVQEVTDMLLNAGSYPTGETVEEVRWRLLVCDQLPDSHARAPAGFSKSVLAMILRWLLLAVVASGDDQELRAQVYASVLAWLEDEGLQMDENGMDVFTRASKHALQGACTYAYRAIRGMTGKGYICQIPPEVQQGDVIAIFYGCDVPYVLRPASEGRYRLVGNCYVHGIMYGEALNFPGLAVGDIEIV